MPQLTESSTYPDPMISASVYCARHLDGVIHEVLGPFWKQFALAEPESDCYLWVVRYSRCGEHVKIRLHGPDHFRDTLRAALAGFATQYFAQLGSDDPEKRRLSRFDIPPIDFEDESESVHPDRILMWTRYRRSVVSLGSQPLLGDDLYAARFTKCLGSSCNWVLDTLLPGPQGDFPHRIRQNAILKALTLGIGSVSFGELRLRYLAYHRDWLLRYLEAKSNDDLRRTGDFSFLIERFDLRLATMPAVVSRLGEIAQADLSDSQESDSLTQWQLDLASLAAYVAGFRGDPDYDLDPFASDPVFPVLFKVFHAVANQLGLSMPEEAFSHHLLLRAIESSGT